MSQVQMTPAQARAVDPIITQVARGYRSPKAQIANVLFPLVTVNARAGHIIAFGPDDFKLVSTVRAPGASTKRVQFGYASDKFAIVDHRLEAVVPDEVQQEGMAVVGIDNIARAVRGVQNVMALERENLAATLARNPAKYGASNKETPATLWDDYAAAGSDPIADVMAAKEQVRAQIGIRPNVLTVGPKVLTALRSHPKILSRLSTAADRPPASIAQLQSLFELEQLIEGDAVYHDGMQFQDVWGKDAILAFTTPASMQDFGSPNFGYTYQLAGLPIVEVGYDDRNIDSMVYPVADAYQPVLAGPSAGFLFTGAVS